MVVIWAYQGEESLFCALVVVIRNKITGAQVVVTLSGVIIERIILWKFSDLQIRKNSIADSTIPLGVSPYLLKILSERDP